MSKTIVLKPGGTTFKRACFACRLCFHAGARAPQGRPCPVCHGATTEMGTHFRAPRKGNKRAWKSLESMAKAGVFFGKYGVGAIPVSQSDQARWEAARAIQRILDINDAPARDALGLRPEKSGGEQSWRWRLREWWR